MGIRLSATRANANKSPCSRVVWRKQCGSCCPINLIMFLLPEEPGRLPERATRAAQYVAIEHSCSAATNLQLPFLLLFNLRFSSNFQSQMPSLTDSSAGGMSINGRTLRLFRKSDLSQREVVWKLDNKKKALATLPIPLLCCTVKQYLTILS